MQKEKNLDQGVCTKKSNGKIRK